MKFGHRGAWLTRRATDVGQWDPSRERNAVSQDGSAAEYKDYFLTGHLRQAIRHRESHGPPDSVSPWWHRQGWPVDLSVVVGHVA